MGPAARQVTGGSTPGFSVPFCAREPAECASLLCCGARIPCFGSAVPAVLRHLLRRDRSAIFSCRVSVTGDGLLLRSRRVCLCSSKCTPEPRSPHMLCTRRSGPRPLPYETATKRHGSERASLYVLPVEIDSIFVAECERTTGRRIHTSHHTRTLSCTQPAASPGPNTERRRRPSGHSEELI